MKLEDLFDGRSHQELGVTLSASFVQSLGLAANAAIEKVLTNGSGDVFRPTGEVVSAEFGVRCFRLVWVDGTSEDFSDLHRISKRSRR